MRNCPECERAYPDEMDFCPRDATPLPPAKPVTQSDLNVSLSQRYRIVRQLGEVAWGPSFWRSRFLSEIVW
jgi:hypothetical protein